MAIPEGLQDVTPEDTREHFEQLVTTTTGHAADPNGVNHPAHYNQHPAGIECIDVVEWMGFNIGSAIKYLWREGLKGQEPSEKDMRKAIWYIEREIERRAGERVVRFPSAPA